MYRIFLKRIIADLILLFGVLYFPWWVTVLTALIFSFYFRKYYELIVAGVLIDVLYGTTQFFFQNISFVYTGASLLVFVLVQFLKKRLR